MTPQEETAAKKRYAAALVRTPDPFAAALELYPEDTKTAAWIAKYWSKDPEVLAEKDTLKTAMSGKEGLPDKVDLSRAIWDRMNGPCLPDDFAKLAKIFAEVNGMIEKQTTPTVVAQIIIPKVIEIPNHGTDSDWEAVAEKQQKDLLSVSRSKS